MRVACFSHTERSAAEFMFGGKCFKAKDEGKRLAEILFIYEPTIEYGALLIFVLCSGYAHKSGNVARFFLFAPTKSPAAAIT